jgi:hypothetical protein
MPATQIQQLTWHFKMHVVEVLELKNENKH